MIFGIVTGFIFDGIASNLVFRDRYGYPFCKKKNTHKYLRISPHSTFGLCQFQPHFITELFPHLHLALKIFNFVNSFQVVEDIKRSARKNFFYLLGTKNAINLEANFPKKVLVEHPRFLSRKTL